MKFNTLTEAPVYIDMAYDYNVDVREVGVKPRYSEPRESGNPYVTFLYSTYYSM